MRPGLGVVFGMIGLLVAIILMLFAVKSGEHCSRQQVDDSVYTSNEDQLRHQELSVQSKYCSYTRFAWLLAFGALLYAFIVFFLPKKR